MHSRIGVPYTGTEEGALPHQWTICLDGESQGCRGKLAHIFTLSGKGRLQLDSEQSCRTSCLKQVTIGRGRKSEQATATAQLVQWKVGVNRLVTRISGMVLGTRTVLMRALGPASHEHLGL